MSYLKTHLFSLFAFTIVFSTQSDAIPIDACMEAKCIKYFNHWKVLARTKRVPAMSVLAELYYQGYGTEKNLKMSIRYFRKASRYQFSYAQYRAGVFYLTEAGYLDNKEGIKYLRKAARNGHVESAFLLAVIFGTGELGIKDVGESDKWLEKALEGKHTIAQKYAGFLYYSGQVNSSHYVKVNDIISELKVSQVSTSKSNSRSNNEIIAWPTDHNREMTKERASDLDDVFDYELAHLETSRPVTNLATGTKTQGRRCEKIMSCYHVNKEDFWRYAKTQSGF